MSLQQERNVWVASLIREFKQGKTTGDLSRKYGITRQGIHNILKAAKISSNEGGRSIKSLKKQAILENQKQNKTNETKSVFKRFGCTLEQWEELRSMHKDSQQTPITLFSHNRSYANRVGILWTLSLWEWWESWKDSGHFESRGRKSNEYCLVRIDDNKGFEKGNVTVVRNDEHYRTLRKQVVLKKKMENQAVSMCKQKETE